MTRTVFCRKYQTELEGLSKPPFPGEAGQQIYETTSQKAWQDWLLLQTRLINEKQLNLIAPETQAYLNEQRERFLANADHDEADGFTPKAKPSP